MGDGFHDAHDSCLRESGFLPTGGGFSEAGRVGGSVREAHREAVDAAHAQTVEDKMLRFWTLEPRARRNAEQCGQRLSANTCARLGDGARGGEGLRVASPREGDQPEAPQHLHKAHAREEAGAEHHPDDHIRGHLATTHADPFPLEEGLLDPGGVDSVADRAR